VEIDRRWPGSDGLDAVQPIVSSVLGWNPVDVQALAHREQPAFSKPALRAVDGKS
jgi:hypothetical protein